MKKFLIDLIPWFAGGGLLIAAWIARGVPLYWFEHSVIHPYFRFLAMVGSLSAG